MHVYVCAHACIFVCMCVVHVYVHAYSLMYVCVPICVCAEARNQFHARRSQNSVSVSFLSPHLGFLWLPLLFRSFSDTVLLIRLELTN